MNIVHLHLAINHSPLYFELFAFVLLLIGVLRRQRALVTAGLVIAIFAGAAGSLAAWSGDGAAMVLHKGPPIAGVDLEMIKEHDLAAGFFVIFGWIAAAFSLLALIVGKRRGERPRWMEWVAVVLTLHCLTVAGRTAFLGGRIHHPEVRAVSSAR